MTHPAFNVTELGEEINRIVQGARQVSSVGAIETTIQDGMGGIKRRMLEIAGWAKGSGAKEHEHLYRDSW